MSESEESNNPFEDIELVINGKPLFEYVSKLFAELETRIERLERFHGISKPSATITEQQKREIRRLVMGET
jgi:hypothetical protein